ncbi:MAG: hypothetical protein WC340_13630 [Kiritimatiellia bacterium]
MKRVLQILLFSFFLYSLQGQAVELVPLPGENGEKAALICDSFPSQMHTFVWRNWSVVSVDKLAQEQGLKRIAKIQAGLTWEFSVIPYLPVMDLVAEHAHNLSGVDVDGVMMSWSLGCYPSPNLKIFQEMKGKSQSVDDVLNAMADSLYGLKGRSLARQAWTAFSDGFREYPFHISLLYNGPQHMGPANPLYLEATGYSATMVGFPYDDLKRWRSIYPFEVWVKQMEKVRHGFEQGCVLYEKLVDAVDADIQAQARRELATYRAAALHFESMINQAQFIDARDKLAAPVN